MFLHDKCKTILLIYKLVNSIRKMKSKAFCYYNHKRNQFLDFLLTGNGIKAPEMESKPTCSCNRI